MVSQDGGGGEREQWKKGDFNDHRLEETFFSLLLELDAWLFV